MYNITTHKEYIGRQRDLHGGRPTLIQLESQRILIEK